MTPAGSAIPDGSPHALWLTETYPPARGGMAHSCDRIVRGLRAAGVTVDIVHFMPQSRGGDRPWAVEAQTGGRYLACPVEDDPAHALNRAWSALTADGVRADVTHVVAFGGSRPLVAGPVFAAWLGVPLVTLIRGNDFDAAVFSTRRRPVLDDALGRSAIVCAVSQDKVGKIAALHPGVPVRRIPNGIELADWTLAPSDRERAAAWRAAEVAPGRRVIGLFGQLKAKKGGTFLLDALLRSGRANDLHVVLAGWLEPELEAWLAERGTELSWTHLPFLDRYELLPWFAACDWIAIPSFYDGLPNVLVEAAALGIPLIAARTGGMADVLVDGQTALLFEPGDLAGCSWALERAARIDPAPFGAACRALAEAELDARLETRRYLDALAAAAEASPPAPVRPLHAAEAP